MTRKEIFSPKEPEIIPHELIISKYQEIAIEREKVGTSEKLIPQIRNLRKIAINQNEHDIAIQLFQEEFLCAQHMVMEERSKGLINSNKLRAAYGPVFMNISVTGMQQYQEEHQADISPGIKARNFRFMGRFADHQHQYKKSEKLYRQGLEYFDSQTEPENRYHRLELLGFISFSLLKQGKKSEGLKLMDQVLKDYDESPEGQWLKEKDYYTWAVWKSGVEIRNSEYLIKRNASPRAKELISDAEKILVMPDGNNEKFGIRIGELDRLKTLIH